MENESVTNTTEERRTTTVLSLPNSALLLFRPFLMKYMAHESGPDALKGPGFISSRSDSIQDWKYGFPPSPRCIYSLTSPAALLHITQNTDSEKRRRRKSWHAVMTNTSISKHGLRRLPRGTSNLIISFSPWFPHLHQRERSNHAWGSRWRVWRRAQKKKKKKKIFK